MANATFISIYTVTIRALLQCKLQTSRGLFPLTSHDFGWSLFATCELHKLFLEMRCFIAVFQWNFYNNSINVITKFLGINILLFWISLLEIYWFDSTEWNSFTDIVIFHRFLLGNAHKAREHACFAPRVLCLLLQRTYKSKMKHVWG